MALLAVVFTFLTCAFALAAVLHRRARSRLTARMLLARDPLEQQATTVQVRGLLERMERRAHAAGLNWTRKSFQLVWGIGLGLGLFFFLTDDMTMALVLPSAALGIPLIWINYRSRQRTEAFATQLPSALQLMANSVRAGGSLYHAVGAVTRQMPEPIRSEFARVERAIGLQVPVADALAKIQDRIGVPEFAGVVIACKVAGDAGADLDKVLESIARELVEDRQFIKAMEGASAEGRSSARLVTGVPIFLIAVISFLNPRYLLDSLKDPAVIWLYLFAAGMIVFGWFLIKKITDVRNW